MKTLEIMQAAFQDELEKISGELQGFTRIGRKPIGIERMLERENESETTPSDVVEKAIERPVETVKVSMPSPDALKALALLGAGGIGYHAIRKANDDRRMGRQVRLQNQGY